jgi:hypothetical protein
MLGTGDRHYQLTDMYLIRFEEHKGSKNLRFEGSVDHKHWTLVWSKDVRFEAACDYDGEIIGVPIDSKFSQCKLERKTDPSGARKVETICEQ